MRGLEFERGIICALSLAAGCYGPNPAYVGLDESGSSTGPGSTSTTMAMSSDSSDTDSSTTSSMTDPTSTTDPSTTTETTEDPSETTEDPTETTGEDPDPTCADGNPDPGEFCFSNANVSPLQEVESLAAGDFDGDGKLDLAIGRRDDVVVLFGS